MRIIRIGGLVAGLYGVLMTGVAADSWYESPVGLERVHLDGKFVSQFEGARLMCESFEP